jgi:hypothetical protein
MMKLIYLGRGLPTVALGFGLACTSACHRHETGIHNAGPADDPTGHSHEEKMLQITVWTNGYEVFAEHQPVAVGVPTTFITHVTDLRTFEPRTGGPVRFILRQGDQTHEQVQHSPDRPGIYLPDLVFPSAGDWDVSLVIPTGEDEVVVPFPRLHSYADAHAAAHANVPEAPSGVAFLKEQQWKIQAKTQPVVGRKLVEQLRLAAVVQAKPGGLAEVRQVHAFGG